MDAAVAEPERFSTPVLVYGTLTPAVLAPARVRMTPDCATSAAVAAADTAMLSELLDCATSAASAVSRENDKPPAAEELAIASPASAPLAIAPALDVKTPARVSAPLDCATSAVVAAAEPDRVSAAVLTALMPSSDSPEIGAEAIAARAVMLWLKLYRRLGCMRGIEPPPAIVTRLSARAVIWRALMVMAVMAVDWLRGGPAGR